MPLYEFTAPCHFGMEAVLKREIINLGYEIVPVSYTHLDVYKRQEQETQKLWQDLSARALKRAEKKQRLYLSATLHRML